MKKNKNEITTHATDTEISPEIIGKRKTGIKQTGKVVKYRNARKFINETNNQLRQITVKRNEIINKYGTRYIECTQSGKRENG